MADTTLNILVKVAGTSEAGTEITGLSTQVEGVGTATEEAGKKTSAFRQNLKALATGFAVYKGFQFLKSAVETTGDLAKSTAQLQRVTGMDTQTSAGWAATAQERGISAKTLATGMATLGRNMQGVAKGSKASIEGFQALGISQKQLAHMNTQQTLGAIADGLAKMPPGAEKAAAAQKLLGRSGTQLLPILNNGSKALDEQVQKMGKMTGITNGNLKSGLALVKQQREMSAAMLGVKVAIGTALIPVLTGLAKALAPIAEAFAHLMQTSPLFRTAIYALAGALIALKVAMFFGATVGTGGIIGAIVGIGILLVTAYTKVKWFRDAVNAAFDFIRAHWHMLLILIPGIGPLLSIIAAHFTTFKDVAVDAAKWVVNAFNNVLNFITALPGKISSAASGMWDGIKSGLIAAINWIIGKLNALINAYNSIVGSIPIVGGGMKVGRIGTIAGPSPVVVAGQGGLAGAPPILAARQHGGLVGAGGELALVGERGPEIVGLPGGSMVYPNSLLGGGQIHTHVYLRDREIAHALSHVVADRQATR